MTAFPFVGPAYRVRSSNFDASRSVNLYPELSMSGTSKSVAALYGTPGLRRLVTLPQGGIRGLLRFSDDRLLVVAGSKLYTVNAAWAWEHIGDVDGLQTPVSMASNGQDVMIVTGPNGYVYRPADGTFTQIVDSDFSGADVVYFLDGYFVLNKPSTGQFYITELYGTDIDGLDFATAEGAPDNIVTLIVDHRELWLFGEVSTEIWFNSGASDFPFERNQGAYLEVGCAAKYSPAKMANVVYWLGNDAAGQGVVYRAQGYQPQRVSDFGVEYAIGKMARVDDAIGYAYQQEGHFFYVLTFPTAGQTWVYDASSQMWHERAYRTPSGAMARHRANCHAMFNNTHVVGDWQDGRLYALDLDTYTDDGDPIVRIRTCPHLSNDLKLQYFNALQVDMETGVGIPGQGVLSGPIPVLLDTFTAADGTDPTTRDMDVFLSGNERWTLDADLVDAGFTAGRITGGVWMREPENGNPANPPLTTVQPAHLDIIKGSGSIFATPRIALYAHVYVTATASSVRVSATDADSSSNEQFEFHISDLEVSCTSLDAAGSGDFLYLASIGGPGWHKVALWTDGEDLAFIVDGAVAASGVAVLGAAQYTQLRVALSGWYGTPESSQVADVGVYDSISLDDAIALTAESQAQTLEEAGVDPQAMLQWSDDGGHTWSNEHWTSIGRLGERKTRVRWRRLGRSRDRVFKLTISDPVKVAILGASVEVTPGVA